MTTTLELPPLPRPPVTGLCASPRRSRAERWVVRVLLGLGLSIAAVPLLVWLAFPLTVAWVVSGFPTGYAPLYQRQYYITWTWNTGTYFHPLDADAATFKVLTSDRGCYALDRHSAFCRGQRIAGSDPATFTLFDDRKLAGFSRDARHVYYGNQRVEAADPESFRILEFDDPALGNVQRDRNHLYQNGTLVPQANPDTWHPLGRSRYARDDQHVYLHFQLIPGADPASFELIAQEQEFRSYYARDALNVYYDRQVVLGADPATFEPVVTSGPSGHWIMRDAKHRYRGGVKLHEPAQRASKTIRKRGRTP